MNNPYPPRVRRQTSTLENVDVLKRSGIVMLFAFIGTDENSLPLFSTIAALESSQILAYVTDIEQEKWQMTDRLSFRPILDWRAILDEPDLTAVVMAHNLTAPDSSADSERLRFLTQSEIPLLVSHPACNMVDGFQLQMIQRDSKSIIQPFIGGINHPLFNVIRDWHNEASNSPIGGIRQLLCYRTASDSGKSVVLGSLAQDVYQLRRILGRIEKVNAIGIDSTRQPDWSDLSVQMVSPQGIVARWAQVPAGSGQAARIEITGETGSAVAYLDGPPSTWSLHISAPDARILELPPYDGPATVIQRLIQASFRNDSNSAEIRQQIAEDWENACRSVEVVESVEQSCRRGKTLELFHEQHTEEATFKSIMAAGGCLMLLVTLMFMIGLQAIATVHPSIQEWRVWAVSWKLVFLVMFGFLGLQLLRLVFSSSRAKDE